MHSFTSDMRMIHSKVADKDTKTTIIKVGSLGQKKSSLNGYQKQQKRNKNAIQEVVVWYLSSQQTVFKLPQFLNSQFVPFCY